jgi:hypothetical protein
MGRSVIITTPIPTADEMAKRLGIGKKRLASIKQIVRNSSNGSFENRGVDTLKRKTGKIETSTR